MSISSLVGGGDDKEYKTSTSYIVQNSTRDNFIKAHRLNMELDAILGIQND